MAKEIVKMDDALKELELSTKDQLEPKKEDRRKKEKKQKKDKGTLEKKNKKKGYFSKLASEIKLVAWPNRKTVTKYSLATIFMVVLLAGFFLGVSALFDLLYALVQGWIG